MWQSAIIFLSMGFFINAEEITAVTAAKPAVKAAVVQQVNEAAKPAVKAAAVQASEAAKPAVKAAAVQASEAAKPAVKAAAVQQVNEEAAKPAVKAAAAVQATEVAVAPVAEKKAKCERSSYCLLSQNRTKTGFFSAYFINSFNIFQDFMFNGGRSLRFGYGGDFFFRDSSFELNINISHATPSFGLKYEQSFLKQYKWFPGFDVSFLFGIIDEKNRSYRELLAVGLEGGPFLTTFVSKYYALIARTGLSYAVPVSGNIFEEDPYFYISFGFKKYFK